MMKKKTATITYHNCNNYGAVLQAYALQQILGKYGYENLIIDYRRSNLSDVFAMFKNKLISTLRGKPDRQLYSTKEFFQMVFPGEGNSQDIRKDFDFFRQKYLKTTVPVNKKTIYGIEKDFDYIITGSDQVWNCGRVNIEPTYLLEKIPNFNIDWYFFNYIFINERRSSCLSFICNAA